MSKQSPRGKDVRNVIISVTRRFSRVPLRGKVFSVIPRRLCKLVDGIVVINMSGSGTSHCGDNCLGTPICRAFKRFGIQAPSYLVFMSFLLRDNCPLCSIFLVSYQEIRVNVCPQQRYILVI